MNEHEIKQEANKSFEWLIKYLEDYAKETIATDPSFRYSQGLASGLRHAAKMVNIQAEYFNAKTKTYKHELPTSL